MPDSEPDITPTEQLVEWMNIGNKRIIVSPTQPDPEPDLTFTWWVREGNSGNRLATGIADTLTLAFEEAHAQLINLANSQAARGQVQDMRRRRAERQTNTPPGVRVAYSWAADTNPQAAQLRQIANGGSIHGAGYPVMPDPLSTRAIPQAPTPDRGWAPRHTPEVLATWGRELLEGQRLSYIAEETEL